VLEAPSLYAAYPVLKKTELVVGPDILSPGNYGKYMPGRKPGDMPTIALSTRESDLWRSSLNPNKDPLLQGLHHEMQHNIQHLEGSLPYTQIPKGQGYWNNVPEVEARYSEFAQGRPIRTPYSGYPQENLWFGNQKLGQYLEEQQLLNAELRQALIQSKGGMSGLNPMRLMPADRSTQKLLRTQGRQANSAMDAERALSDGDRVFVFHEQGGPPVEIFSSSHINAADQFGILPKSR
jgi:hypothetical protein